VLPRHRSSRASTTQRHESRRRRWSLGLVFSILTAGLVLLPALPASAAIDSTLQITKSVSGVGPYAPGQSFTYTVTAICASPTSAGCINAQLVDDLPAPLVFDSAYANPVTASVAGGGTTNVTIAGTKATVDFTASLSGSDVGLKQAKQATVTLRVKVPADASADYNGPIENTATIKADNAATVSDKATVTIAVTQHLEVEVTKERTTPSVIASVPGIETDFTIVGTNTSNQSVTSLTLQDPTNTASVATGPFQYLKVTGLDPFTAPAGAENVKVEWINSSGVWATSYDGTIPAATGSLLPSQLADIYGLRFTFTSTTGTKIPVAGKATIGIQTVTRDNVTSIPAGTTEHVTNTVEATVADGGSTSTPAHDSAAVDIANVPPTVTTTKAFEKDNLLGGETSGATIRTTNGPMPVHTMTISEPGSGDDLAEQGLLFEGFTAGQVEWPATATSVSVVYTRANGTTETRTSTTFDTLPAPTGSVEDVVGFQITFTSTGDGIDPYAYAVVPFTVKGQPVTGTTTEVALNTTTSKVTDTRDQSDTDTASDSIDRLPAKVDTTVGKTFIPDELYAAPGSTTLVNLTASVAPRPASTVGSDYLDITDPSVPASTPTAFWDCFQIKKITDTAIPANSTLEVQTWNGTSWTTLTTVVGPQASWSYTVPAGSRAAIQGIRFHFTRTGGGTLAPGFNVAPNFNVSVRPGAACLGTVTDMTIGNEVESQVENAGSSLPPVTARDDDDLILHPLTGTGPDMIDKTWVDPSDASAEIDPVTVGALTGDTRVAKLKWSTQGFAFDSVTISDPSTSAELTNVAGSIYDAFNLTRILPITTAQDPHIGDDKVSKVEVYSRTSSNWIDITSAACALGCTGTFGGYNIPVGTGVGQTEDVLGVRLTFVSRDSDEPVAVSIDNDRVVQLAFTIREKRRSDSTEYVLGQHHTYTYNTSSAGMVHNTVLMEGVSDSFSRSGTDGADVIIIDRPLNVELTKSFSYSPLGLPPVGTPADEYPLVDADLEATNATTSKVSGLRIQDPIAGTAVEDSVFDTLNLYDIRAITYPAGLAQTDISVTVGLAGGGTAVWTYADALAKTPAELADVVSIDVKADKEWIAAGAKLGLQLTFQLRANERTSNDPMTITSASSGPVHLNEAQATVSGPGGISCGLVAPGQPCDTVTAEASDDFQIQNPSYDVVATKAINFASRYEDQSATGYVATLTGQPTGTARTTLLTLTDSDPRFWNAFDLTSITAVTPVSPVNQIRVSVLSTTAGHTLTYGLVGSTLTAYCDGLTDLTDCWTTGAWTGVSGGTIAAPIPAGVTAANVRGIKIEARNYQSGAAVQWERPNNPKVTVALNLTRRTNLWWSSAGSNVTPVPSTLPGMALAPGEPTQGTIHNQLLVEGIASWGNPTAADPKWTASATANASTVLQHRINKIRVVKAPGNPASHPLFENGGTVPYVMTVTNSGAYTMKAPTFTLTDQITPVGGSSPVTAPPGAGTFKFTLTGTGSAIGSAQPTASLNETTGELTFTFASGFTFPAGAVLKVEANLEIRADLPAGTSIKNSVTASADRDFEECRSTTDETVFATTGSSTTPVSTCTAKTTVEVQSNSPLEMVKSVRGVGAGLPGANPGDANYDDLGVLAEGQADTSACQPGGSGAADADGFYTWPCVPITRPGGTEEWKIDFTNGGNTNASVVAGIDVLPAVNDQGVVVSVARGSKFGVTLLNEFESNIASLVNTADAQLRLYVTDTVPTTTCTNPSKNANDADIRNSTTPGGLSTSDPCYANVTARNWTLVTPTTDVSAARAFKFVLVFGDASDDNETSGLEPGETFSLTYQSTTPAYSELATSQAAGLAIAWNSVAAGSRVTAAGSQPSQASLVTEPRQVGISMPTGQLELSKVVSAPTWSTSVTLPSTYDFDIECESAGEQVPLTGPLGTEDRSTVVVPADDTVVYNGGETPATTYSQVNLPWGATCVLAESGEPAGDVVSYAPTNRTLTAVRDLSGYANIMNPMPAQTMSGAQLTVTNTYSAGGFTVSKTVDDGGAVDQDGDPVIYGPFSFTASCTYLGQEVVPTADQTFTLDDGETKAFADLPTGASCTVTETDDDGADETSVLVTKSGVAGTSTTSDSTTFTIVQGTATTITAAFTNAFTTGSLKVTKTIDGNGATAWGNEDFTVHVTCTLDGDTVYDGDSPAINKAHPVWTIDDLATGAACVVTEPDKGGANSTTLDPVGGTATIGDGTTETVEVTNTFTLGALTVSKVLAGPAATDPGATTGRYTMELTCTRTVNGTAVAVTIPGGARQTVVGEDSYTWTGLPTGATCSIAEVDSVPSTPDVVVSPSSVVIGDDETTPVDVTVTNTFETGTISLSKVVTGASAAAAPTDFEVTVTCEFPVGTKVVLPNGGVITLNADGTPVTLSAIPTGSVCTAEETDAGQTTVDFSPSSLTVGDGTTVDMTVTNTYESGSLQIVKDLAGVGASVAKGPYEFSFDCSFNGNPVTVAPVTLAMKAGATRLTSDPITDLPVRTECTVTETSAGNAVEGAKPVTVAVTSGSDVTPVPVTFVNKFGAGIVKVTKIGKGPYKKDPVLKKRPVKVNVTCEYTSGGVATTVVNRSLKVLVGQTATLVDAAGAPLLVPVGSVCWVSELDSLGATEIEIAHGTRATGVTVTTASTASAAALTFTVKNTYKKPPTGSVADYSQERGDDKGDVDGLSDTGSPIQPWLLGLIGMMLVAGGALVVAARRRS
jgi:large repetitive protein